MRKKRAAPTVEMMQVKVVGPRCWVGNRLYRPGETATVPADLARVWIQEMRALAVSAEVKDDNWQNDQ
jgi:hypothetical protein